MLMRKAALTRACGAASPASGRGENPGCVSSPDLRHPGEGRDPAPSSHDVARQLSIKIRNQLVLEIRDHVLQLELALLEPRQMQLVATRIDDKTRDRFVEIAMLDLELGQLAGDGG